MPLWSVDCFYLGGVAATLCLLHTPCLALASRWLPGWFLPNSSTTNCLDTTCGLMAVTGTHRLESAAL